MAWKRQNLRASIEVETHDFSEEQLLQALINCKWISEKEAEIIAARAKSPDKAVALLIGSPVDPDFLDEARRALRRGDRREAVHYVEQHLGREWIGTLQ